VAVVEWTDHNRPDAERHEHVTPHSGHLGAWSIRKWNFGAVRVVGDTSQDLLDLVPMFLGSVKPMVGDDSVVLDERQTRRPLTVDHSQAATIGRSLPEQG
jgi:hypothetical protein